MKINVTLKKILHKISSPRFLGGVLMVGMVVIVVFGPTIVKAQTNAGGTGSLTAGNVAAGVLTAAVPGGAALVQAVGTQIGDFTLGAMVKLITFPIYLIEMLIAGLLGLSGLILDQVIKFSVTNLASNIQGIKGIGVAWTLIRDLCNMSFIFILLYEAIMMVFGKGDAKKIIVPIIIAALLINFSLFFTEIIIDASNVVTVSFYNSLTQIPNTTVNNNLIGTGSSTSVGSNSYTFGLSGAIISDLQLTSLFGGDTIASSFKATGENPGPYVLSTVGGALFMLVATFIFLAMAVLFIIRYVMFIILLIMAPFGIVGSVIPGTSGLSKKYWESLSGQALFAPIFMIMMWITLTLAAPASGFLLPLGTASLGASFASPTAAPNSINIILNFALIIGLLIATILLSKSFATKGGIVSGKIVNQGTSLLGGAVFGSAGAAGRNSIGRIAARNADVNELEKRADNGDILAKTRLNLIKGSYDMRRSAAGEKIQGVTGIDLGKGHLFNSKAGEGGFAASQKKDKDRQQGASDAIVDNLKKKRNWAGVGDYIAKLKSDDDKAYVYRKLSAVERAAINPSLNPALVGELRKKLPIDSLIDQDRKDKNWAGLADFLMDPKTKPADQEYIYEKLSPRDRVDLEKELETPTVAPGRTRTAATGTPISTILKASVSTEEQEKTGKARKEAGTAAANKQKITDIEALVGSGTGTPAQYDALFPRTGRDIFPIKAARELSNVALADTNIISRLTPKHLNDIINNKDDLDQATIDAIVTHITGFAPGTLPVGHVANAFMTPIQKQQYKYITAPAAAIQWGV